jgi:uncharacterized repeat protein (TIGR03806 family)
MNLRLLILAAACILPHAACGADAPVYQCRWTDEAIKLDGTADEPAWRDAQTIDDFRFPWQPNDKKATRAKTKARLLWDREYLYIFADLDDADLLSHVTEHDGKIWSDDVLELFLKPALDKPGYYEFQVNPAGAKLDMFIPKRSPDAYDRHRSEGTFHFDAQVALRGTPNNSDDADRGWSVEARIAWRDLMRTGGRPEPGETWRFALCRYDYAAGREPELSTCAPLSSEKPDFHRHEDYAPLRFIGPDKTAAEKLLGQQPYVPVAGSRVIGSPDPPLPYRAVRALPNLKLSFPIAVHAQPGDGRLLIIDQAAAYGNARVIRAAAAESAADSPDAIEVLLDLDESAYGLAFHPRFAENGYIYVGCNGAPTFGSGGKKTTRVKRYTMSHTAPHAIDRATAHVIIEWPSDGHNGGDLVFGNDGMLYVTSGDGTSDSDADLVGQDMTRLTAKVLRIDVDHPANGERYSVPADNPFVGRKHEGAPIRPETWAYGLRNPWRICVDRQTGAVWVGNNGQDLWEQAYRIERGANYGWSVMEGSHVFYADRKLGPTPPSPPTVEHPHSVARSLTGGVVYRGERLPALHGAYIYGDYSTGKIWGVLHDGKRIVWHKELADTTLAITGFGVDRDGEILICDHRGAGEGGLYRLEPTPVKNGTGSEQSARQPGKNGGASVPVPTLHDVDFPRKLSETGLFQSVAAHQLAPGAIPYSVNSPLWSDGAYKERYLVLPPATRSKPDEAARIEFATRGSWNFPDRTVLVKSFAIDAASPDGSGRQRRWIETRLFTRQEGEWAGYSYLWNDEQTDAALVDAEGADRVYEEAGGASLAWHYPSRTECMVCHSRAANFVLGLSTEQLNRTHHYPSGSLNQLAMLERLGLLRIDWQSDATQQVKREMGVAGLSGNALEAAIANHTDSRGQRSCPTSTLLARAPADSERLADPADETAPIEQRARSYLHANCAQCHQPAGGGNAQMDLRFFASWKDFNAIDVAPMHDTYGIADAKIIVPGHPERSLVLARMSRRGRGQMPQLATTRIDEAGTAVIRRWIAQLKNDDGP